MTMELLSNEAHVADGDILRFHDGECNAQERTRIAAHVAGCDVGGVQERRRRR